MLEYSIGFNALFLLALFSFTKLKKCILLLFYLRIWHISCYKIFIMLILSTVASNGLCYNILTYINVKTHILDINDFIAEALHCGLVASKDHHLTVVSIKEVYFNKAYSY